MAEGVKELSVNMEINAGEFVMIFGKSGVGKTSLLRMISGLFRPDCGIIKSGNETWFDAEKKVNIPVQKRNIGFVFQNPVLFPNMTIMETLRYAAGKNPDKNYLRKLLKITELHNMSHRKPEKLSGGQQQRVALIRALAQKPTLLLLDEPFSSLDLTMRQQLLNELKFLHTELHLTTLLVSHDLVPLIHVADRLIEIKNGMNKEIKDFSEIKPDLNTTEKVFQGKINKVYGSSIGFVAEIRVNEESLKIPVSEKMAVFLKEKPSFRFSLDGNGNIRIHDEL
ncbi:MAG TPA: ATP-binding cassette domain-containing protein [Flavobacteriaceae bacterium]|nr:ATP-binding cassette domain-containing protein [Flavobacteriaceae bacterium]